MEANLASLVALLIVIVFIVVGIRISVFLFSQRAEATHHFMRVRTFAGEQLRSDTLHTVNRPKYHRVLDTSHSNSRLAMHTFMAIAFILLLTIVATISILFGSVH